MYLKLGFGRTTQDSSIDIRRGSLSRDQAVQLVKLYDDFYPENLFDEYCDYYKMSKNDFIETLDKWVNKDLFEKNINKKMICTNPDLIVDRGNKRELCAGSVAMVFEKMGGEVIYFGKPYPEVYNQSIDNKNKKILSIGDNLNTDIKGANLLNFDSLIISNGIHKSEIKEKGIEATAKSYETVCNYIQSELKW